MSRKIEDLHPDCRAMVEPWLADVASSDIDLLVTCTLRTLEEQAILYAQGRTTAGKIVTNAKPGTSAHNYGLAIDVVPLIHGKPDWAGTSPVWTNIAALAHDRGLQWFGAPDSPYKEQAHFQVPNWRHIAGVP
jgi:peptidoglycan L-alanyl-D-glutamate endopeptidase CwlK